MDGVGDLPCIESFLPINFYPSSLWEWGSFSMSGSIYTKPWIVPSPFP